jgi:hypothetical protein
MLRLTVKVICCDKQLEAQLRRDIHILNVLAVRVLVVVVQVFADLLEYNTTIQVRL